MQISQTVTPTVSPTGQENSLTLKDYSAFLQPLIWPVFGLLIFLIFRRQFAVLFHSIGQQIKEGASVEVAGVKLTPGRVIEKTADLGDKVETAGNPDNFKLLFKAQGISQGSFFKKSTKAMVVPGGCIIQVTNERQNPDGSWSVAESLVFFPGNVSIKADSLKSGNFLDVSDSTSQQEQA